MARSRCDICAKDISKPSLVRCNVSACPLRQRRTNASRDTAMGIAALGAGILAVLAAGSYFLNNNGESGAAALVKPGRAYGNNPITAWLDKLVGHSTSSGDAQGQSSGDVPDWGASSRVATFSCTGRLSAARELVCSNWDLATTDYNLSIVYRSALAQARNAEQLRRDQSEWLAELDRQSRDKDEVLRLYSNRIEELQRR